MTTVTIENNQSKFGHLSAGEAFVMNGLLYIKGCDNKNTYCYKAICVKGQSRDVSTDDVDENTTVQRVSKIHVSTE